MPQAKGKRAQGQAFPQIGTTRVSGEPIRPTHFATNLASDRQSLATGRSQIAPHAQYGVIGIGFAMLTWFVAVAAMLVVATTGGATIADRWIKQ